MEVEGESCAARWGHVRQIADMFDEEICKHEAADFVED